MMLDCTFRLLCYCILAFHRNYWFRNELVEFEKEGFTPRVRKLFKDIVSTEEIAYKNISNSKCWLGNAFDKAHGRESNSFSMYVLSSAIKLPLSFHEDWLSLHENFRILKRFALSFPGLKCVCLLCDSSNFTCQTEGACWASVMLTNGKEQVIKSCVSLPELNAQVFCHSSNNVTKTECCFTDFCNNITLHLPTGKGFIFVLSEFHFTLGKL